MKQYFKDLTVYQKVFNLVMRIFEVSKSFPKEEKYSLTDQIRRSSRSAIFTIAEAYRKRKYEAHFISKTSDADMENSETQVWLEFSLSYNYIDKETYNNLLNQTEKIGKMLNYSTSVQNK